MKLPTGAKLGNIGLFADIFCTLHSALVREKLINGQMAIPKVFH